MPGRCTCVWRNNQKEMLCSSISEGPVASGEASVTSCGERLSERQRGTNVLLGVHKELKQASHILFLKVLLQLWDLSHVDRDFRGLIWPASTWLMPSVPGVGGVWLGSPTAGLWVGETGKVACPGFWQLSWGAAEQGGRKLGISWFVGLALRSAGRVTACSQSNRELCLYLR